MAVPNQKQVTVVREEIKGNDQFIKIKLSSVESASANLNGNAFKVWLYLARHTLKEGEVWELSPEAIAKHWGVPKSSVQKAVTELKEKQYLVPKQQGNNIDYYFYELPETKEEVIRVERAPAAAPWTKDFVF